MIHLVLSMRENVVPNLAGRVVFSSNYKGTVKSTKKFRESYYHSMYICKLALALVGSPQVQMLGLLSGQG